MRLDKYLADMSVGTRSQVKKIVKDKRVKVNGEIAVKADMQINDNDEVTVDDLAINYVDYVYYLLNKPKGYYSTLDRTPNVCELVYSERKNLFPIGRLDKDTEGVILITNDGQLAHSLLSPKRCIDKIYYVITDLIISDRLKEGIIKPIEFKEFTTDSCTFEQIDDYSCFLTIHEGKYHQVKRMFEHFGYHVDYLKRVNFAGITLGDLKTGEFRELTKEEVARLKEM